MSEPVSDPVLRLRHLLDQAVGAVASTAHAEDSADPIVRATTQEHVRNYLDISIEIQELVRTSPEARAEFFAPPKEESA